MQAALTSSTYLGRTEGRRKGSLAQGSGMVTLIPLQGPTYASLKPCLITLQHPLSPPNSAWLDLNYPIPQQRVRVAPGTRSPKADHLVMKGLLSAANPKLFLPNQRHFYKEHERLHSSSS